MVARRYLRYDRDGMPDIDRFVKLWRRFERRIRHRSFCLWMFVQYRNLPCWKHKLIWRASWAVLILGLLALY